MYTDATRESNCGSGAADDSHQSTDNRLERLPMLKTVSRLLSVICSLALRHLDRLTLP